MQYQSTITCQSKDIAKVKVFNKQVKHQGKKCVYPWKDLVTILICEYQSPSTYHSKVIAKLKIFGR
jgi:hypothetical protein